MAIRDESTVEIRIEVLLMNGLSIKQRLSLHPHTLANCEIHGQDDRFAIEATHWCENRDLLYQQLQQTLPTLVHDNNSVWFQTINKCDNPSESCLFDEAKMKLHILPLVRAEFGFCFPRTAFVAERSKFDIRCFPINITVAGNRVQWRRRLPSDEDRLQVNREGWEVLYFIQPVSAQNDATFTDLRNEICNTLNITDSSRVTFEAGPFTWGPDFVEDNLGIYKTYFSSTMNPNLKVIKTIKGSALINIIES
ncbi:hypothetical protein J3E69DRAFT_377775 [Trichoderma sp. SZMC 28015]